MTRRDDRSRGICDCHRRCGWLFVVVWKDVGNQCPDARHYDDHAATMPSETFAVRFVGNELPKPTQHVARCSRSPVTGSVANSPQDVPPCRAAQAFWSPPNG